MLVFIHHPRSMGRQNTGTLAWTQRKGKGRHSLVPGPGGGHRKLILTFAVRLLESRAASHTGPGIGGYDPKGLWAPSQKEGRKKESSIQCSTMEEPLGPLTPALHFKVLSCVLSLVRGCLPESPGTRARAQACWTLKKASLRTQASLEVVVSS